MKVLSCISGLLFIGSFTSLLLATSAMDQSTIAVGKGVIWAVISLVVMAISAVGINKLERKGNYKWMQ